MRFLAIPLLLVLILPGCRKADRNHDTDTTLMEDAVNAHSALFEIFLAAHEANLTTPGIRTFLSGATLTADTLGNPRTLIVDFGSSSTSPTGRTRCGKMIIYQNGYYSSPGSTSTIYFDSLYINGYNYSSTIKVVTTSTGYFLKPNNLKIASPDSSFFYVLSGSYTLSASAGTATTIADDDEFITTGSLTINGRLGGTGVCTVMNGYPLVVKAMCAEVVTGKIKLQPAGLADRILDFGSGTCDGAVSGLLFETPVALSVSF